MLKWFIRFPKFTEFSEFLIHLGKTPLVSVSVSVLGCRTYLQTRKICNSNTALHSKFFGPIFFITARKEVCLWFCSQGGGGVPVFVRGISVWEGVSVWGVLVQGVSVQGSLSRGSVSGGLYHGDPHMVMWGRYTSYWNAFLFSCTFQEKLAK